MNLRAYVLAACAALALSPEDAKDAKDDVPPTGTAAEPSPDAPFIAYQSPATLFINARVVDGTGAPAQSNMDVFVRDGRIVSVTKRTGPRNQMLMSDVKVIDLAGKTLLPGFVMVHEHMFYPSGKGNYSNYTYTFPRLYLAGGTTTARTGGSMSPYGDLNLKLAIDKGEALGPDLDVTGPYLNGPGFPIYQMHVLADAADATRTVDYWADEGATSFKAYMQITRAELKAVIDAAHARGAKVTGHLCSVTYREAAELGIDNLEHGFAVMTDFFPNKAQDVCPSNWTDEIADVDIHSAGVKSLIKLLVARHVAVTSTLAVWEPTTPGRPRAPEGALALLIPELRKTYEDRFAKVQTDPKYKPGKITFAKMMKLEKMFVDAGGTLLAGTDPTGYGGVVPGFAGKRQIELLVEEGFTFPQALKIATLNGARFLGRDKDVGSIEVGKRADFAVIDGDPAKDASALEHMPLVFKAGVGYDTQKIFDAMKGQVGLY